VSACVCACHWLHQSPQVVLAVYNLVLSGGLVLQAVAHPGSIYAQD
jgi:hypothetical protein